MERKTCGIMSLNRLTKNKIVLRVFLAVCCALLLILGYILVFQPILFRFVIPTTDIHHGLQYFIDLSYTEFESGDLFSNLVRDIKFDTLGQTVDFYHVDNRMRDNPVYGKHCDVFALDVQMNHHGFQNYREEIASQNQNCGSIENFKLFLVYAFDSTEKEQGEVVLIAFNEHSKVVRLILMTDKDTVTLPSVYTTTLIENTSLMWN